MPPISTQELYTNLLEQVGKIAGLSQVLSNDLSHLTKSQENITKLVNEIKDESIKTDTAVKLMAKSIRDIEKNQETLNKTVEQIKAEQSQLSHDNVMHKHRWGRVGDIIYKVAQGLVIAYICYKLGISQ